MYYGNYETKLILSTGRSVYGAHEGSYLLEYIVGHVFDCSES